MEKNTISSDLIRGNIDTIILRILQDSDNYGYEIIKAITQNSHNQYELKEPSLYTSLKRLEGQQLIESYWGDESQGGRRKYYRITPTGITAYDNNIAAWKTASELLNLLMLKQEDA